MNFYPRRLRDTIEVAAVRQSFAWWVVHAPGLPQGAGFDPVVADAVGEGGPSAPPYTAATRQRYEVEGCKPLSAKLGPEALPAD